MADSPRLLAIRYLKDCFWTPGKIQRLLDDAEAKGVNPLQAAHNAAVNEAVAHYAPIIRRYEAALRREGSDR